MVNEQRENSINKQKLRKKALRRAIHRKNALEKYVKKQTALIERKQKVIDLSTNRVK